MSKDVMHFSHICMLCFTPGKDGFLTTRLGRFFRRFVPCTYCATCKQDSLIPINTPKARELMKRIGYEEH